MADQFKKNNVDLAKKNVVEILNYSVVLENYAMVLLQKTPVNSEHLSTSLSCKLKFKGEMKKIPETLEYLPTPTSYKLKYGEGKEASDQWRLMKANNIFILEWNRTREGERTSFPLFMSIFPIFLRKTLYRVIYNSSLPGFGMK